ncbi:MAG: tRNA (N6-isopentenyl adenosine(37)-C2)-methylthiotransferase MiaB [Anaerolineales bacterium]|nr:tRNA (N6-isopentenyl adenosine(37)-C2)-methylthiotransferase MiaB [Anaerolineales bacterium]MCX7609876.1 tRNA (N6-isopentenyl adenosine(37)-C2)-methylthiotransferase MiaB [Anaerolineales bacterium]MDW8227164.1 tRNA (N6-isopentenyl adenosine(37)-C2)-methylthiotransferase MiaB [Anaerolineales bacterium]MDW8447015.1 tRNA (N6-isopentenyl adenosine(37)-C2)-methylthiotransferase MiaB [Anaerolineales bacterium]
MKKYHVWTEGCQMNVADSRRVESALERLGYQPAESAETADVIVLNTCVVRQSAEDKAYGRLNSLRPLKMQRPDLVINLMGCLVGIRQDEKLRQRFPFVDVFSPPSDPTPLIAYLLQEEGQALAEAQTSELFAALDEELPLPQRQRGKLVSAHVPIVLGCSHACTFCIIPSKRGAERSRPLDEIEREVRLLVEQGVREVTLLGQIVDRYGKDLPDRPTLSDVLRRLHRIDGLVRIRFLTSHPNYFDRELMETVAELPKVMPHIEIPVQAGNDEVLKRMRRGYTQEDYRRKIEEIRACIPGCSIATDIIVGFPGETEEQFMDTYRLLEDLRLDAAHLARYSPRPGTVSARNYPDDVPEEEKMRRFRLLEELQERIVGEINATLLGQKVEVLFEEKVKNRWRGRTPTNKLVFVESESDLRGQVLPVTITWTGPWSMLGKL